LFIAARNKEIRERKERKLKRKNKLYKRNQDSFIRVEDDSEKSSFEFDHLFNTKYYLDISEFQHKFNSENISTEW